MTVYNWCHKKRANILISRVVLPKHSEVAKRSNMPQPDIFKKCEQAQKCIIAHLNNVVSQDTLKGSVQSSGS